MKRYASNGGMSETPEGDFVSYCHVLAFAQGYADGQEGRDSPPYMVGSEKHAIYEAGRIAGGGSASPFADGRI